MTPRVLHRDAHICVVDKPSGMPVIATRDGSEKPLQSLLQQQLGQRLWVVHRIDRDTSGLVLFALNAQAHRWLCLQFEQRSVAKTYQALVAGAALADHGEVRVPLHGARKGKMRPAAADEPGALEAHSSIWVQKRWPWPGPIDAGPIDAGPVTASPVTALTALLSVQPHSGRQHQIRVHLRALNAPILCDPLYQPRALAQALAPVPIKRLALHANKLAFLHPNGERCEFSALPPEDFIAAEAWLDARCRC